MRSLYILGLGWGLLVALVGCNMAVTENIGPDGSADKAGKDLANVLSPERAESISPTAQQDGSLQRDMSPAEVVRVFLESLREGDNKRAAALLTDVARYATSNENLVVQHPGSPTAEYQVGRVQYVSESKDGAHVSSTWSENDGAPPYEITWTLRRQESGWRIKGMITPISDGGPNMFLDFEDPAGMMQRLEQVSASLEEQAVSKVDAARNLVPDVSISR